eukprot:243381_1
MFSSAGNCLTRFFATEKRDKETKRERWDSRLAFILAASGSAVGLGNLWRFPALAFKFGGGAFFIPYLMALFLIGIPLFILELGLGQVIQTGDIGCFGSIHKRLRGVGLGSVFGGFMVVCYYNAIIAWSLVYLVQSFQSDLPWKAPAGSTGAQYLDTANDHFSNNVLSSKDANANSEVIVGKLYAAMTFVWAPILFVVIKGISRTSKIVYVTMLLPAFIIIVLVIRGATLSGSLTGVTAYIGEWDMSSLSQGIVWSQAVTQIFFSIGVTFGIMTAYSSYNSRYSNTVQDAYIIALVNSAVSIFAGFAVFSVLGFLSEKTGTSIKDLKVGGPSLAFVTYPVALAETTGSHFFSVLFFLTLFFLGIDSAFSLAEAVITAFKDSNMYNKVSRTTIVLIVCFSGFLIGTLYVSDLGVHFLDVVDAYVNNILMMFIGFMESYAAGWLYNLDDHITGGPPSSDDPTVGVARHHCVCMFSGRRDWYAGESRTGRWSAAVRDSLCRGVRSGRGTGV